MSLVRLIPIGWWGKEAPHQIVDLNWRSDQRSSIVDYLRSGKVLATAMGWSSCRFKCGTPDFEMGSTDLTDGTWVWPEGLDHYVSRHGIRLPEEFADHANASGYRVRCAVPSDEDYFCNPRLWVEWCLKHGISCAALIKGDEQMVKKMREEIIALVKAAE